MTGPAGGRTAHPRPHGRAGAALWLFLPRPPGLGPLPRGAGPRRDGQFGHGRRRSAPQCGSARKHERACKVFIQSKHIFTNSKHIGHRALAASRPSPVEGAPLHTIRMMPEAGARATIGGPAMEPEATLAEATLNLSPT